VRSPRLLCDLFSGRDLFSDCAGVDCWGAVCGCADSAGADSAGADSAGADSAGADCSGADFAGSVLTAWTTLPVEPRASGGTGSVRSAVLVESVPEPLVDPV